MFGQLHTHYVLKVHISDDRGDDEGNKSGQGDQLAHIGTERGHYNKIDNRQ